MLILFFRAKALLTRKTAWIILGLICIFSLLINSQLFFTRELDTYPNSTETYCKPTGKLLWNYYIYPWIDMALYFILPSLIITCMISTLFLLQVTYICKQTCIHVLFELGLFCKEDRDRTGDVDTGQKNLQVSTTQN